MLSRQLVKRQHQVVVCTIGKNCLNTSDDDDGVKVIRLEGFFQRMPFLFKNTKEKYPPPIKDPSISRKLQRIIANEKPDIIHTHGWLLYSVLDCKEKLGIPLVVTLHDYARAWCARLNATKIEALHAPVPIEVITYLFMWRVLPETRENNIAI